MKFTLVKDLKKDPLMRPIISSVLLFSLIYLISDFFVKQSSFGLLPSDITNTLFGNEDEFLDPISKDIFLEFWHVEIFFTMMIVFILSTIHIRVSKASKNSIFSVNILMISSILSLVVLPLSYFISLIFIEIYVVLFFIWHSFAIISSLISLKALNFA